MSTQSFADGGPRLDSVRVLAGWPALAEAALEFRGVVEVAKGILRSLRGCDADHAFDRLRRASQREDRKLRVIAEELVERASTGTHRR